MRILGLNITRQPQNLQAQLKSNSFFMSGAFRTMGGWLRSAFNTFQGQRDIYQVYGYKRHVGYPDAVLRYLRQDIAKRVVKLPADAIWANPPIIKGTDTVNTVLKDLVTRLNLWQVMNRADRVAGMASYCAILCGINDGQTLDVPVAKSTKNIITFMQPYSSDNMPVTTWVTDPKDPRFGLPLYYTITPGQRNMGNMGNLTAEQMVAGRVHWSRIVHVVEDPLEDLVFGSPRLVNVFNLMDDFLKVGGGSAEVYWLNSRGGLHINVDKDMDLDPGDEADLSEEADEYTNNMRRIIRTRGVDVKAINMKLSDPRQTFDVLLALLAAATGIPQRMMVGTEAGQLASEQDRANWATNTEERRANFAEPYMLRPLLIVCAAMGLIAPADALNATIKWPEAFHLSPLERAQTSAQQARSAANLVRALGLPASPGTEDVVDPETGAVTPGQLGDPGMPALVTIKEARKIIFMGDVDAANATVTDNFVKVPAQPKVAATPVKAAA